MAARSEDLGEDRAPRFVMWRRLLSSSLLTASSPGDRPVGVASGQHAKAVVCLPALNVDSSDLAMGGSDSVQRWPSLASSRCQPSMTGCSWCSSAWRQGWSRAAVGMRLHDPRWTRRAGDLTLPRVIRSPPSLQQLSASPSTSSSMRMHSSTDASKQLQVIYLHMWMQVSGAGSGPHFCALLADLRGAHHRGDKADALYQDSVMFLVR